MVNPYPDTRYDIPEMYQVIRSVEVAHGGSEDFEFPPGFHKAGKTGDQQVDDSRRVEGGGDPDPVALFHFPFDKFQHAARITGVVNREGGGGLQ